MRALLKELYRAGFSQGYFGRPYDTAACWPQEYYRGYQEGRTHYLQSSLSCGVPVVQYANGVVYYGTREWPSYSETMVAP